MRLLLLATAAVAAAAAAGFVQAPPRPAPAPPPRPPTALGLVPKRYSLVFDFPDVPYSDGVRHIHTVEHVTALHRVGVPFFRIHSVSHPIHFASLRRHHGGANNDTTVEGVTAVDFQCSSLGMGRQRVRMFSASPDVSNMVFTARGRSYLVARLRVSPLPQPYEADVGGVWRAGQWPDAAGHRLEVNATLLDGGSWVADLALPLVTYINAAEDNATRPWWWPGACSFREHARLALYRRMVLRRAAERQSRA